jgi:hypothetical protein
VAWERHGGWIWRDGKFAIPVDPVLVIVYGRQIDALIAAANKAEGKP